MKVAKISELDHIHLELSSDRKDGYYSDSEEEDAPHFPRVSNHTKMYTLNRKPEKGTFINNYALSFEEVTPSQLKADAEEIHHAIPEQNSNGMANRKYGATTILCVALVDKYGRVKKFAFSNSNGIMGKSLRVKAHELRYHVVQAQQAHAEGELLQFLQERGRTYTHIIALGCDKDHCKECDWALNDKLEGDYLRVSGNRKSTKRFRKWYIPPALAALLGQTYTPHSKESERHKRHKNGSWNISKLARVSDDEWKTNKRRERFLARQMKRKQNGNA